MLAGLSSVLARVAAALRARFRRLPPGERPFVPPFVGAYRTRPFEPPPPPEPAPTRPPEHASPNRGLVIHLLISLAFVAAGILLALFPHKPSDRFWGLCSAGFFGLCTWVFIEQLLAGADPPPPLPGPAARRMLAALFLTGAGGVYLAWTGADAGVGVLDRLLCGVFSVGFLALSVGAAVFGYRTGRLSGRAPPRAARTSAPPPGAAP